VDHDRVAEALDDLAAEILGEVCRGLLEGDGDVGGDVVADPLGEGRVADEVGEQEGMGCRAVDALRA
jgi:hypothetical protein